MSAAENAATDLATQREALVAVLNDARPSPDRAWEILNTWDALVAQAETAETDLDALESPFLAQEITRLRAEREAAVQALRERDLQLDDALENADANSLLAIKAEAEREHAREALRQIAYEAGDANLRAIARDALSEDST